MAERGPDRGRPAGAGTPAAGSPNTHPADPTVGGGRVALVAVAVAAIVLGAAVVTAVLPPDVRAVVVNAPLVIAVLIVVTAAVLWRAARH